MITELGNVFIDFYGLESQLNMIRAATQHFEKVVAGEAFFRNTLLVADLSVYCKDDGYRWRVCMAGAYLCMEWGIPYHLAAPTEVQPYQTGLRILNDLRFDEGSRFLECFKRPPVSEWPFLERRDNPEKLIAYCRELIRINES